MTRGTHQGGLIFPLNLPERLRGEVIWGGGAYYETPIGGSNASHNAGHPTVLADDVPVQGDGTKTNELVDKELVRADVLTGQRYGQIMGGGGVPPDQVQVELVTGGEVPPNPVQGEPLGGQEHMQELGGGSGTGRGTRADHPAQPVTLDLTPQEENDRTRILEMVALKPADVNNDNFLNHAGEGCVQNYNDKF